MLTELKAQIPLNSHDYVIHLLHKYPCTLKIVNKRKTKHGDFRRLNDGSYQITINNDLNKYRFLLTLIHEISHLVTFETYAKVKPHGKEWKLTFQHLMLPLVNPDVYPHDLLGYLAMYLKNPKAATDSDVKLSLALKNYDPDNDKSYIFEIPLNEKFVYNKRTFELGKKRRTRYECIELSTSKIYLFHQNTEVTQLIYE